MVIRHNSCLHAPWTGGGGAPPLPTRPWSAQGRLGTFQHVRGDAIHIGLHVVVGAELALAAVDVEAHAAQRVKALEGAQRGVCDGVPVRHGGPVGVHAAGVPHVRVVELVKLVQACEGWGPAGVSLTGKKKKKKCSGFPKKPAGTPCAQPWLVAVGGWRLAVGGWQLATGGWWRLVVVGGGWWLAVGGRRQLAVVGSWRLVAAGGWRRLVAGGWWRLVVGGWWRLAVDGSWRLAVGWSLGADLKGCP